MLGTFLSGAASVAAVVLAVPVVAAICVIAVRGYRHMRAVHEAIVGKPEGPASDAIPSIIERFHAIDTRFDAVEAHLAKQDSEIADVSREFRTNGGKTVKDDLAALRKQIDSK